MCSPCASTRAKTRCAASSTSEAGTPRRRKNRHTAGYSRAISSRTLASPPPVASSEVEVAALTGIFLVRAITAILAWLDPVH
jgi:hypothetical protein